MDFKICLVFGVNTTMASRSARKRVGVDEGGYVRITNLDKDASVVRRVHKIYRGFSSIAKDDILFVPEDDAKLLCVVAGDRFDVSATDDNDEFP